MENGNDNAPAGAPDSPEMAFLRNMQMPLRVVIDTMIRGMISSAGANIAPGAMMSMIAWNVGNISATMVQGDLTATLKARKAMQDAYADGVRKAQIQQQPMPPGVSPDRLRS